MTEPIYKTLTRFLFTVNEFILKGKALPLFFIVIAGLFHSNAQEYVPFTPRLDGGSFEVRGDIIFVGNNILNRATQANPAEANVPYNGTANNNSLWMEYIDIDTDPTTFSSSSAELNLLDPSCSQVRYAGLYWASTYPNERSTNGSAEFSGTPRIETWNEIKFKVPGGTYVDLVADNNPDAVGEEDDIIMNGYQPLNPTVFAKDAPVICYKNITDLVRTNADPSGEYTAANIRATRGRRSGSSSAGWVMVVIYENPNESGKFISTFDGYAGLSGAVGNVDVDVDGFRTLPAPFPVRARVGVGALEGDRGISNDRFFIRADLNSGSTFTNLTTGLNPANNFFNSTITTNGAQVPTRTPFGTNTLGTDLDLFNLNNPSQTVLPNGESGATLRFTSSGDGYGPFLATFSVEIIEPNIILEKRVEDIAGNDITGAGVNLGQTLDYVLSFRNLGNDDAVGYTIRDVLPVNTAFTSIDVTGAPGVTHTVDAATNEITFFIPDALVEMGNPLYSIRMRVRVAENCFDFVNACSDSIENLAYSTYQGDINSATISDDPSVSDFDNCGFVTPGATNFLLDDLSLCTFRRTAQLCGDNVTLDSGDGFDNYVWYLDVNQDGLIDGGDVNITGQDGNPDNDPSTIVVTEAGVYIVDKQIADPCKGFTEIITVERFGTTQTNPIVDFFNNSNSDADTTNDIQGEIVVDCNDGTTQFPKIALCGVNDSQLLRVNISDAQGLTWERLNESSCTVQPENCLNRNLTCTWNPVATGSNFTVNTEGKYRLSIRYQNGCVSRFYFDVFQNNLDIVYTSRNVVCETEGNITITNLGGGYGYQLVNATTNAIEIPFSANNGPSFDFTSNGAYRVEVVQLNPSTGAPIEGACIFSTPDIGILNRVLQVDVITTDANCNALGSAQINANNVFPNYVYELRLNDGTPPPASPSYVGHPGGTLVDSETAQPSNTHTFNAINPGNYFIVTRSDDGCVDVQSITIDRIPDPLLSAITVADIACTAGSIALTRTGGQGNPDFLFAIWSKDGTVLHTPGGSPTEREIVNNIDPNAFQVETTFTFGWRDTDDDGTDEYFPNENGTYRFIVLDANNCYAISSPVTINDNGSLVIDSVDQVQPSCSGDADGELTINVLGGIAPYEYSIDNGTTYQPTPNFVGLTAGPYAIRVLDSSGCDVSLPYNLNEPFPLSASAGVSRDATCDPMGGEVRITNVVGGSGTYEYSFNGGSTWGPNAVAVLPPGDYTVLVRDGSCSFPMNVTVEGLPEPPNVSLTPEVSYNCDGTGTITASPSITGYDYRYELDGVGNAPDPTSNVFTNVSPGTYTVRTYYSSQTPPTPSLLLTEDFGIGNGTIPSPDVRGYVYEDQTTSTAGGGDTNRNINDYQYSVTNRIVAPFGTWLSPNDHTDPSNPNGRFLVINVGTPSAGQIIYTKPITDIIPNRPLRISLNIFNLVRSTATILDPDLTIEIVDAGGAVIESIRTGDIAKNTGPNDWVLFTTELDPGTNTDLDFVIRTEKIGNNGNDLALDDIRILQIPEVCELFVDTPVTVEAGLVFGSTATSSTNVSCNGLADGTITFSVANFNATAGFEYSEDNQVTWITSTSSPVTTSAVFGAGSQTVFIRKADEITCTTSVTRTITEPSALVANANITTSLTCTDTGTIRASATGGSPGYTYQLEDTSGVVMGSFDFATNGTNRTFSGLNAGDYIVRVRDLNGCEDVIDAALTLIDPDAIVFDLTPTACYSGANNGSIAVDVTAGNGGYQFRMGTGPWITPSPASATTYTFQNLSAGTYSVAVRDQLQCPVTSNAQTVTINPQLIVDVDVTPLSSCNDGEIAVNVTGGNGTILYAIVPANSSPSGLYTTTNTLTITAAMATANPAGYDVYVQDNNGAPAICTFLEEDILFTPVAALTVNAVPTDPQCFDGLGTIDITVSGGTAPFEYELVDLSPADGIDYGRTDMNVSTTTHTFNGIGVGDYEINITDTNGCTVTSSIITINNAVEITADILPILPATCNDPDPLQYGFEFDNVTAPSGTLEYSADNGTTWQASNELRGYASGTEVFPSIRVEVSPGVYCQKDFDRYIIPFPLDDLDITLSAVIIGCNDLRVTVEGSEGDDTGGYDYTYTDDPANFNTFILDPNVWVENIPSGTAHTFQNIDPSTPQYPEVPLLIPGRTYVFYVRDGAGCIRQSNILVNEIPGINLPIEISAEVTPSCDTAANGAITFTLNPSTAYPQMRWEIFELGNTTPIETSGGNVPYNNTITTTLPLAEGDYYIDVVQVDGTSPGNDACRGASENVYVPELAPLAGNATATRDISCNLPGLITITGVSGGGGAPYRYDVAGPSGFTSIVGTTNNPVQIPVNSPAGAYTVTLYDQYSCPLVLNTVNLSLAPNPTIAVIHDNCASPITVTATGSSAAGNLRYAIVPNGNPTPTTFLDNGGVFNNVAPGSYDVYVMDGNGCTASEIAYLVDPVLSASAELTKILDCTSAPNAEITIAVAAGSGNYQYEVTGPVNVPATNLPSNPFVWAGANVPGNYTVTVFDTSTPNTSICNREYIITVPDRIVPVLNPISTTDVTCIGDDDGTITVSTATNGAAPYSFEIIAFDGTAASIAPTSATSTSATFTGLEPTATAAGYVVRVTGAASTNGCFADSGPIMIAEPLAISVTMNPTVEFGCSVGNVGDNASISVASATGGSNSFVRYQFINDLNPTTPVQDGTNTTYIETNTLGGNYTINVFDSAGCIGTTTASIAPFVRISAAIVTNTVPVTCNPGDDAQIQIGVTVDPSSATPNLEYTVVSIDPGYNQTITSTNNPETFTGLGSGNYRIRITNLDTGCVINTVHTVNEPLEMEVLATKLSDEECLNNGIDDGSFGITISDYAGTYSYQVFDSSNALIAGQSGNGDTTIPLPPITDLPGGSYYVQITQTEAPFCVENSNVITVIAPEAAITAVIREEANVTCSNDQGRILINPDGGQGPYTIVLNNTVTGQVYTRNNVSAFIFNTLSAGIFNVTITDAFGCDFTDTITLIRPDAITAAISASTLVCYGDNDASVTATIGSRNVSPTYRYQLNVYSDMASGTPLQTSVRQANGTFDGIGAGFYSITVTDDIGCSTETDRIRIVDPTIVNAQLVTINPLSCTSGAALELRATGGTAPYTYSEDGITYLPMNETNGPNTHLFTGLGAGTYRYFVRDSFNCASIRSNEITEDLILPLTLEVDATAAFINCTGDSTGIIFADADGGLGNYRYALYTDASLSVASRIDGPKVLGEFRGLAAGIYYVEVVSDDCTTTPERVEIIEPMALSYVEEVINVSCEGENNGQITVTLSGGAGGYQYSISPNLNRFDTENTFTDLSPGDYTIIAQDRNGCFEFLSYTITEPTVLNVGVTTTPEICIDSQDGTITLDITGGTAPYSTALNANGDSDFVLDRTAFVDMAAGNYLIFIRDANGCEMDVVVDIERGVNLNAIVEPIYECSGTVPENYVNITLEDTSVIGEILYALDSEDPSDLQLNPDFRNTAPGDHYITIAHSNGCIQTIDFVIEAFEPLQLSLQQLNINEITATAVGGREEYTYFFDGINNGNENTFYITRTDTYEVRVVDENGCETVANLFMEFIDIEIPRFFTPDGDGLNEFWIPRNMEQFPEILIKVFDRYGRVVFTQTANSAGWDGRYLSKELPTGDYWYIIKLNGERDEREFVGHFTLYR